MTVGDHWGIVPRSRAVAGHRSENHVESCPAIDPGKMVYLQQCPYPLEYLYPDLRVTGREEAFEEADPAEVALSSPLDLRAEVALLPVQVE